MKQVPYRLALRNNQKFCVWIIFGKEQIFDEVFNENHRIEPAPPLFFAACKSMGSVLRCWESCNYGYQNAFDQMHTCFWHLNHQWKYAFHGRQYRNTHAMHTCGKVFGSRANENFPVYHCSQKLS